MLSNSLALPLAVHYLWTVDKSAHMKSQDIAVLLKLVCLQQSADQIELSNLDPYSMRSLAEVLRISKSEISNSIKRSLDSGLVRKDWETSRPEVNRKALFEFIKSVLKYVFPVKPGALTRGIHTAFAAPVLNDKIMSAGEDIVVNGSH